MTKITTIPVMASGWTSGVMERSRRLLGRLLRVGEPLQGSVCLSDLAVCGGPPVIRPPMPET